MARKRYAACMACRSEAQKTAGITDAQNSGLSSGRVKGTNHRTGYSHRPESKQKASASIKQFYARHPELAIKRAEGNRGENHYRWKGGSSKLNTSIRQMTENRKWMEAIKTRDARCVRCGSIDELEAHHIVSLAELIERLEIRSRADARMYADTLWDMANGETLCKKCHYIEHGRTLNEN